MPPPTTSRTGIPLLFFTSFQPVGNLDTYVSELASDGAFGPAVLVPELNSPQSDGRPNIRHDGREIFFYSDRPGTIGLEDLWVATRETTLDAWSTPVNLGVTVNSASRDIHPAVSSDRQTLFFGSNRPDPDGVGGFDLYMTTRTKLHRR
jgi:Tol biopolymer transport system component